MHISSNCVNRAVCDGGRAGAGTSTNAIKWQIFNSVCRYPSEYAGNCVNVFGAMMMAAAAVNDLPNQRVRTRTKIVESRRKQKKKKRATKRGRRRGREKEKQIEICTQNKRQL